MIETSSDFGNLWRFSENVWKRLSGLRTTFEESLETCGKWSEIFGKMQKILLCIMRILYNKKKITVTLRHEISLLVLENISLTFQHSKRNFVSPCSHVISSISLQFQL